jgi:ribonuclease HI
MEGNIIYAYFDGSCSPNPNGKIGLGGIIQRGSQMLGKFSLPVDAKQGNTNNVAEYMACFKLLTLLKELKLQDDKIVLRGDSKLVINQLSGVWGIKSGAYARFARNAQGLSKEFTSLSFEWIPRDSNTIADALSTKNVLSSSDLVKELDGAFYGMEQKCLNVLKRLVEDVISNNKQFVYFHCKPTRKYFMTYRNIPMNINGDLGNFVDKWEGVFGFFNKEFLITNKGAIKWKT